MEARDLRIGNIVEELLFNRIGEISSINKRTNRVSIKLPNSIFTADIKAINPIPLTEEWLIKLGYKLSVNGDFYFIAGHIVWICNDLFMCEKNGIILKSVHQLQNLIFSITGTELIIKNQ